MAYTSFSSLARLSLAKSGKWITSVAFVGGIASDVLNPLGPFAGYIAVASLAVVVLLLLAMLFRFLAADRGIPAVVFALISCVVTGGIYSLQKSQNAENGIVAKLVPAVGQLQQSLGLIAAKVDKIDKTVSENLELTKQVQETAQDLSKQTAEVQKQTAEVKQQTTQIAAAVEEIAAGFKTLGNQGGVIANPERPDQFYHNARIHELGGDVLNARQSYLGFAKFNVDAVDAYARFATLLKVSEGRSGAREVLGALRESNKTKSLELVWTQLLDDSQRTAAVEKFAKSNPDFGPASFALADEYSEDRLGARTLSEKREEKAALDAFMAAEKSGGLVKYFVDQAVLSDWTGRAQTRLTALGNLDALAAPSINPMRAGTGWQVTISLPEPATAIYWRLKDVGQFVDTGKLAFNDQQTGQPMVNPSFQLPGDAAAGDVEVKYVDIRGRENGPFAIAFDPNASLVASQKMMIEQTWTGWIAFDASGFRGNLYFTALTSFSCGIKEVKYSFNGAPLDKVLDMPKCNPAEPFSLPADFQPYMKVGEDVKSMSVEVTYADGTKSGVKEFKRP
jgi:TolA-binding protein